MLGNIKAFTYSHNISIQISLYSCPRTRHVQYKNTHTKEKPYPQNIFSYLRPYQLDQIAPLYIPGPLMGCANGHTSDFQHQSFVPSTKELRQQQKKTVNSQSCQSRHYNRFMSFIPLWLRQLFLEPGQRKKGLGANFQCMWISQLNPNSDDIFKHNHNVWKSIPVPTSKYRMQ